MATNALLTDLPDAVVLEDVGCPMGCPRGEEPVLTGHDRLHALPGTFSIVRCKTCGLMRTNPRPDERSMSFYYPDDYQPYADTSVSKAGPRKGKTRPAKRQGLFRRLLRPDPRGLPPVAPGRLLELGCASGSFLHKMAQAGWEVEGIEPSAHAARQACAAGYKVRNVSLEAASDPEAPFDIIVGWMVLEHLHEPLAALQKLRRWVPEDGWLVLSVPDAGGLEFKLFNDRWYALHLPAHLHHFSRATLTSLLAAGGWKVERIVWHRSAKNTLMSLSYLASDLGCPRAAAFFRDAGERRRFKAVGKTVGILMGLFHQSGRMTVWARPG
ncbi:class I SAM-dependent methyltransferase [Pelagibius marinus]|uniref:class I SAM-dependent methyltransferase n=1 Tax=Pelagibius marinus TaxID=2762760 RepID=UPI0018722728|nr:class I SAM-dependent methyltransferase [Pelagibius marinus]